VVAVIAYLGAAARYHHTRRRRWPAGRTACWLAGAVVGALSVNSALAVYGRHLMWVHMIVHLLMITVVPAFAVWAQPIRLLHDAGGPQIRRLLRRLAARRMARWLIARVTVPLYAVVLVGTHLTGFQELVPAHMWLHDLELVLYLLSGYLLLVPIVGAELTALTIAPMLRFAVLALSMGPDTLVGVVLMLTRNASAPDYSAGRDWGPGALADQSIAGAIMWWGGDGLMMILMLVVVARWVGTASGRRAGIGPWLERIRRQTVTGTDTDIDIDDDDAALRAYNTRMAALHGVASHHDGHPTDAGNCD
jgi:putative copper resistance protein D